MLVAILVLSALTFGIQAVGMVIIGYGEWHKLKSARREEKSLGAIPKHAAQLLHFLGAQAKINGPERTVDVVGMDSEMANATLSLAQALLELDASRNSDDCLQIIQGNENASVISLVPRINDSDPDKDSAS